MSLLSLIPSLSGSINLYSQIYNDEEFINFVNNCGDQEPEELIRGFFRNILHKHYDPYAEELLKRSEFDTIFSDDSVPINRKIATFTGRAVVYYHTKYIAENESFSIDPEILNTVIISFLNSSITREEKERIKSCRDVYAVIIEKITDYLVAYFDFLRLIISSEDSLSWMETFKESIKILNEILEYETQYNFPPPNDSSDSDTTETIEFSNDSIDDNDGDCDGNKRKRKNEEADEDERDRKKPRK